MIPKNVKPIGRQHHAADKPPPIGSLPSRARAETYDRQRRLHGSATFVGRLPFGDQCAIVELKARRLLGNVDVNRGSAKRRGGRSGNLATW
jgi:hypothetical protein